MSAPSGPGAAIGYGLGGARELDVLGPVWYLDYDYRGAPYEQHQRLFSLQTGTDLAHVASIAKAFPGEWWQFGNEPNDRDQDNVSPSDYARRFHTFYYTLKAADSTARIVPAGIADADWKWAQAFREAYRAQFARDPRVDGWNIHNYSLATCEAALDVQLFQSRITAFRAWMERIGDAAKPLLLTEYGVLYGNGCCGCPRIPPDQVAAYMRSTTRWMAETRLVQGWAWFAVRTGGRFNGDLFTPASSLTLFGLNYQALVAAGIDHGGR